MYFFYIDETGNRDPSTEDIVRPDGRRIEKDWLYVLTAAGVHEQRWKRFYGSLVERKRLLIDFIYRTYGQRLELSGCEVKSTALRHDKQRKARPFLSRLTPGDITDLADLYYRQLEDHHMPVICVVIDKRKLASYMDKDKIHRKAWELLCERIELYIREKQSKNNALLICDDMSIQDNKSLAMKHAYFLESGTTARRSLSLDHVIEMPMFVTSELSEGIQLADLCSYNFYRAFKHNQRDYPFFRRVLPNVYRSGNTRKRKIDGLKIFPDNSPLKELAEAIERWDEK